MGAGKRRAKILVETLETRYKDALATRESLESKAQAGMRLMEDFLTDLEARALAVREGGLSEMIDGGCRRRNRESTARQTYTEGKRRSRYQASQRESTHQIRGLARSVEGQSIYYPWIPFLREQARLREISFQFL